MCAGSATSPARRSAAPGTSGSAAGSQAPATWRKATSCRCQIQKVEKRFFWRCDLGASRLLHLKSSEQLRRHAMKRDRTERCAHATWTPESYGVYHRRHLLDEPVVKQPALQRHICRRRRGDEFGQCETVHVASRKPPTAAHVREHAGALKPSQNHVGVRWGYGQQRRRIPRFEPRSPRVLRRCSASI